MATMNISLPDDMKAWIESRVGPKYGNASDFMRDLVRKAQERQEYIDYLNTAIDEGIASGFQEVNLDTLAEDVFARVEKSDSDVA